MTFYSFWFLAPAGKLKYPSVLLFLKKIEGQVGFSFTTQAMLMLRYYAEWYVRILEAKFPHE